MGAEGNSNPTRCVVIRFKQFETPLERDLGLFLGVGGSGRNPLNPPTPRYEGVRRAGRPRKEEEVGSTLERSYGNSSKT